MKTSSILAVICVTVLTFLGLRAIRANQAIERELAKAKKVEAEIRALEQSLDEGAALPADLENQIRTLERANGEIHRLRNEVSQLRQQTNNLMKLRDENLRLSQGVTQARKRGAVDVTSLGFIPRDQWLDVGLNTPEESIKTFFHYFSQGNIREIFARSIAQNDVAPSDLDPTGKSYQEAKSAAEELVSQIEGFRIDRLEELSATEVIAHIQTALDGELMPIKLHHINREWRIDTSGPSPF